MKKIIALVAAVFIFAAPLSSEASGRMVQIKGAPNPVPEFLSESELRSNGGVKVSNAVFTYQGVVYVEFDFANKMYRADCCIDSKPS